MISATVLTISNVGRSLTADLEGMTPGDVLMARLTITALFEGDTHRGFACISRDVGFL